MRDLPNNCRRSEIAVYPKNWKTCGAAGLKSSWYIKYTFYDDNLKQSKQIQIKANRVKGLDDRRAQIRRELSLIDIALEHNGFNPITKSKVVAWAQTKHSKVYQHTPLVDALRFAQSRLKLADSTMKDITQVIANVEAALPKVQLTYLTIGSAGKKDLKELLEHCAVLKKTGKHSDDKYNRMRSYLGILYAELLEYEVVPANIPLALKKKDKAVKKKRDSLTTEQRQTIDKYLHENYKGYWRFVHIFFHSGARETEIMRVRVKDVDIKNQRVKYLIKKGKSYREEYRVIKDISLPFWIEAIEGAESEWFVFSDNKMPGSREVRPDSINTFWYRHCKKILGVTADFYSLKHINTTETRKLSGIANAALQNAESEDMIRKHYDLDHEADEFAALRKVGNKFA